MRPSAAPFDAPSHAEPAARPLSWPVTIFGLALWLVSGLFAWVIVNVCLLEPLPPRGGEWPGVGLALLACALGLFTGFRLSARRRAGRWLLATVACWGAAFFALWLAA